MAKDRKIIINEFHSHPGMEAELGVDSNHVIIDKESFQEVLKLLSLTKDVPWYDRSGVAVMD